VTVAALATRLLEEALAAWSAALTGRPEAAAVAAGRVRFLAGDLLLSLVEREPRPAEAHVRPLTPDASLRSAAENVAAMLAPPSRWTDHHEGNPT